MSFVKIYNKKLTICTLLASVFLLVTACDSKQSDEKKSSNKVMSAIEVKLALAELSKPLTQEDNEEIYQQWGEDWLEIINTIRPLSAELVYQQPECDMVEKLELSDKSIIQETPIIDVFCENEEVFSLDLNDVTQEKRLLPNSKRLGRKTADEFINACLTPIRPILMYPDSIVADTMKSDFQLDKTQQKLTVQIPISVQTGYDTKISHLVSCQVNSQLNATAKLNPMLIKDIPKNNNQTEQ